MTKTTTLVLALIVCLFANLTLAQEAKDKGFGFTSVTISSGEDAISSGITGVVELENQKKELIQIAVQAEQAWVLFGKKFNIGKVDGTAAGSVGHFQGAPWVGPFLTLEAPIGKIGGQDIRLFTMQWPAFFIGWEPRNWKNDGVKNPENLLMGYLADFELLVGPIGLTYVKLNFLDDPWNTLPGMSYTQKVREDLDVKGSVSRSMNAKKWFFYIGATWKPGKK